MLYVTDVGDPIEPITLHELREYLGYGESNERDDNHLRRIISEQRSALEDALEKVIVQRHVRAYPTKIRNPVKIRGPLREVLYARYKFNGEWYVVTPEDVYPSDPDIAGENHIPHGLNWDEDRNIVYIEIPQGARNVTIDYLAGYPKTPEDLRGAMLMMCKARHDRIDADTIAMVEHIIRPYYGARI